MHYRLFGEITAEPEGGQLDVFNNFSKDKDEVILLEISSLGGHLDALMLFLNRIHEAKLAGKKIVTWASGPACSAGATLLWQGHEVYVSPVSLVMFHNSCETVIHGPLTMLWIKCLDVWQAFKTGKKDDFGTFSDKIFGPYEPWDLILKCYGEANISGDYYFNCREFAALKPEKVKVGIPPYKLELFGNSSEDMVSLSEVLEEVQSIRDEQALEEAIAEEEEAEEEE